MPAWEPQVLGQSRGADLQGLVGKSRTRDSHTLPIPLQQLVLNLMHHHVLHYPSIVLAC